MWGDAAAAMSSSPSSSSGAVQLPFLDPDPVQNNILAIHVERFLATVVQLTVAVAGEDGGITSASYVPVVDACHYAHNCASFAAEQPVASMASVDVVAMVSEQPQLMLFNAKVRFLGPPLLAAAPVNTESAWEQFLRYHKLAPCRVVIAGAPFGGKTGVAVDVAKALDLKYIDVGGSLRWAASQLDDGDASKTALVDSMTSKLAEGLKKGAPPPTLDPATFEFTEAFVAALPVPLVRQCVARRLAACPHSKIKGYVLDTWSVPDIVVSVADFCELLTVPPPLPPPDVDAGSTVSTATPEIIVVELESSDRGKLVDRFAKSVGVAETDNKAKLSKEIQAALKAFETRVDAYWPKLRETPRLVATDSAPGVGGGEEQEAATRLGHAALLDVCDALTLRANSVGAEHQEDAAAAATYIVEFIVKGIHGEVGWLVPSPAAPSSSDSGDATGSVEPAAATAQAAATTTTTTTTTTTSAPPHPPINGDDLAPINQQLSSLGERERQGLVTTCFELLEYLEANVTPFLARCLVDIERQKPDDPLAFMIAFLEEQSAKNQAEAKEQAHAHFLAELDAAEKRYQPDAIV